MQKVAIWQIQNKKAVKLSVEAQEMKVQTGVMTECKMRGDSIPYEVSEKIQVNILVKGGEYGRLLKQYAEEGIGERVRLVGITAGSSHASRRAKLQREAR